MDAEKCKRCGSTNLVEKPAENGTHHSALYCADCGRWVKWNPKPKDANEPPDVNNEKWRKKWRKKLNGELVCFWCGIKESETRMSFHIDHVLPREKGGQDVFENTQPLCAACHWLRHAERHRVKYAGNPVKIEELSRKQMYENYLKDMQGNDNDDEEGVSF